MVKRKNAFNDLLWFLVFSALAVSIFLFRGFLLNEHGGVIDPLVGAIISFLVLMIILLTMSICPILFRMISLEKNGEYENRGIIYLFKKSVVEYRDIYILIFFSVLFISTITIWLKTYNYRGQASDIFFIEKIYDYSLYVGIIVMAILVSLRSLSIYRSVNSKHSVIEIEDSIYGHLMKLESYRLFFVFMYFILFLGAFLSDLINRSTDEAMVGVYIFFYMLALTIPISIFIFIGMLIVTKGIKKSFISKLSFLLLTTITSILIFYVFFRMFLIDVYI